MNSCEIKFNMAQVIDYVPEPNRLLLCDRQGLHKEQPLDLVCLDPLCRNRPLACSVCFNEIHKFHRVITLSKFYDDYTRNTKRFNRSVLSKQILQAHTEVMGIIKNIRQEVNSSIDSFEHHVNNYADYLQNEMQVKYQISREFGVELDTKKITKLINLADLKKSVGFILDNTTFDTDNNMADVSELLVSNSSRILALASKLQYMTLNCERAIEQAIQKLDFAQSTVQEEKITARVNLANSKFDTIKQFDLKGFHTGSKAKKHLPQYFPEYRNLSASVVLTKSTLPVPSPAINLEQKLVEISVQATPIKKKSTNFNRSNLETEAMTRQYSASNSVDKTKSLAVTHMRFYNLRHPTLKVSPDHTTVKSSINALIPQYVLAEPNLQLQPLKISKWALRIIKCRNFSCLNTLAVGLASKKEIQSNRYELRTGDLKHAYMINSQGDVFAPGGDFKNKEMRFSEKQTLYFKYDPFYNLFEMKKENGKVISLRTFNGDDPLYFCVRMTYASDQVQIIRD